MRQWVASIREDVLADLGEGRKEVFVSALESLRHILSAAWTGFDGERTVDELYERAAFVDMHAGVTASLNSPQEDPPLQRRSNAPRYLALAMQAQREINRILGLPSAPTEIDIPAKTAMSPVGSSTAADSRIAALHDAADPASARDTSEIPARTATSSARPARHATPAADSTTREAATRTDAATSSPTAGAPAHAPSPSSRSPRPLPKHQAQPPLTRRARQRLTGARLLKPHAQVTTSS